MRKVILMLSFLSFVNSNAQDLPKEIEEFKISALPYYNYGKGLGMTSADSLFQLNLRFRMQNRASFYNNESRDDNFDAQIRRLRLRFDGYVGNPQFQYAIQLSFAPGDVGEIKDGEDLNIIRDAVVTYKPNKHWNFLFGQTKLPGNRQRVNSSGSLQLTDRSINNAMFNIDRDFGFQIYYLEESNNKFAYNIKTAVSSGNGRNWSGKDTKPALTGKIELYPFGNFKSGGEYFEGDIKYEETPKLMISGVYHNNFGANLSRGQQGDNLFNPIEMSSVFVDMVAKYKGWAAMFAYMNRNSNNPITYQMDSNNNLINSYAFVGHGTDYQLSYTFNNHYEIIGRYSNQKVDDKIFKLNQPNQQQFSLGLTKYIWEHAFKIQGEISYDKLEYFGGLKNNNWYARFQIEIGI